MELSGRLNMRVAVFVGLTVLVLILVATRGREHVLKLGFRRNSPSTVFPGFLASPAFNSQNRTGVCAISVMSADDPEYLSTFLLSLASATLPSVRSFIVPVDPKVPSLASIENTAEFVNRAIGREGFAQVLPYESVDGLMDGSRYARLDHAFEKLREEGQMELCDYTLFVATDALFLNDYGTHVKKSLQESFDMIGYNFIAREDPTEDIKTEHNEFDNGQIKCHNFRWRDPMLQLGSVLYRTAFLLEKNLRFADETGTYYKLSDNMLRFKAMDLTKNVVIHKPYGIALQEP